MSEMKIAFQFIWRPGWSQSTGLSECHYGRFYLHFLLLYIETGGKSGRLRRIGGNFMLKITRGCKQ